MAMWLSMTNIRLEKVVPNWPAKYYNVDGDYIHKTSCTSTKRYFTCEICEKKMPTERHYHTCSEVDVLMFEQLPLMIYLEI